MFDSIKSFFSAPIYPQDEESTRSAELLSTVLNALFVLALISLLALALGGVAPTITYAIVAIFAISLLGLRIFARLGYIRSVSLLLVLFVTITVTLSIASGGTIRAPGVSLFILTIVISGLILGRRAAYWAAAVNSTLVFIIIWLEINGYLPEPYLIVTVQPGIIFAANAVLVASLLSIALSRINESLERARSDEDKLAQLNAELEQRVELRTAELAESTNQIRKRAAQFEAIANTARSAANASNLDELLPTIARDISIQFGFYHVGVFLLDESKEYAILRATNSAGGAIMLGRGHRLKVGAQGIVGYVTQSGTPRTALDVGEDAVFFNNPDLPDTHSEMALPLMFGREIIGAVDIQSTESNAFTKEDVAIFSILADQVSVAIQNTRSLEQAKRALQEAQVATSQLTGHLWKGYIEKIQTKGYRYDGIKPEPLKDSASLADQTNSLSIPVNLRGQIIGRLKLRANNSGRQWTEDELAIIESTAGRVALAIDGARLLEEAQKRAARETFLSEIGSKLGTSFQLDSILRDTVEELGQTLQGSTVSFQLINPATIQNEPLTDFDESNEQE